MITIQNIIDAINIILLVPFSKHTFYIENVPKDFKRPSFYIQLISDTWEDSNRATTVENPSFQIIYFGNVDDYRNTSISEKLSVFETVKGLFKDGYLLVKSEVIKLSEQGFKAELRENEVYFTVDFEYFALRNENEPSLPTATEIKVNVKGD